LGGFANCQCIAGSEDFRIYKRSFSAVGASRTPKQQPMSAAHRDSAVHDRRSVHFFDAQFLSSNILLQRRSCMAYRVYSFGGRRQLGVEIQLAAQCATFLATRYPAIFFSLFFDRGT
jgi:hypothetical protein